MDGQFCFLKGLVACNSGRVQDCNIKHVSKCPMEEALAKNASAKKNVEAEKKLEETHREFCFLKGLVDCNSGRIQDCNIKRVRKCPMEDMSVKNVSVDKSDETVKHPEEMHQEFCYLKGLVDCNSGRIQDCNIKRVRKCPMDD